MTCRFLGKRSGSLVGAAGTEPIFVCQHPNHRTTTPAHCAQCPDFDATTQPGEIRRQRAAEPTFWLPDGDGKNRPVDLGSLYRGATAFVVLGGPSVTKLPLELLGARGVLLVSFNNNPAVLPPPLRPHIWLHNDPPRKMHDSLWRDPSILKFSPVREWAGGFKGTLYKNVRRRAGEGFEPLGPKAVDLPAVIGFARSSHFDPDRWLVEPTLNNGNCRRAALKNGWPHVINTLFATLKLVWLLGFDTVHLVGADFRMNADRPYAFDESKSVGGVAGNNWAYVKMDTMLAALAPRLAAAGMTVYNATPRSELRAFPFIDFREAVAHVTEQYEQRLDTRGWYSGDDN